MGEVRSEGKVHQRACFRLAGRPRFLGCASPDADLGGRGTCAGLVFVIRACRMKTAGSSSHCSSAAWRESRLGLGLGSG